MLLTLGNTETILGQAMIAGKKIGFTGLEYPETEDFIHPVGCDSLSCNNSSVDGKVVLCFTEVAAKTVLTSAESAVRAGGGVGVIVARYPSDILAPSSNGFPCVVADYELGIQMLFYIRSTSYPK